MNIKFLFIMWLWRAVLTGQRSGYIWGDVELRAGSLMTNQVQNFRSAPQLIIVFLELGTTWRSYSPFRIVTFQAKFIWTLRVQIWKFQIISFNLSWEFLIRFQDGRWKYNLGRATNAVWHDMKLSNFVFCMQLTKLLGNSLEICVIQHPNWNNSIIRCPI